MSQKAKADFETVRLLPKTPFQSIEDGKPALVTIDMAEIRQAEADLQLREKEFWELMKSQGRLLTLPAPETPAPADFEPLIISGPPLSQTIIEDRG